MERLSQDLGIGQDEMSNANHAPCQTVGGAVEWLEHDGMLIPCRPGVPGGILSYSNVIKPVKPISR